MEAQEKVTCLLCPGTWGGWWAPAGCCGTTAGSPIWCGAAVSCPGAARSQGSQAEHRGHLRKMQCGRGDTRSCQWTRQEAHSMSCTRVSPNCAAQGTFPFLLLLFCFEGAWIVPGEMQRAGQTTQHQLQQVLIGGQVLTRHFWGTFMLAQKEREVESKRSKSGRIWEMSAQQLMPRRVRREHLAVLERTLFNTVSTAGDMAGAEIQVQVWNYSPVVSHSKALRTQICILALLGFFTACIDKYIVVVLRCLLEITVGLTRSFRGRCGGERPQVTPSRSELSEQNGP